MRQDPNGGRAPGIFCGHLDHSVLVALYDHWYVLRRAAGGQVPVRRAFDPMSLRKLLPFIELYRRQPDGRLRCCLSGTAIRTETGREHTGLYLDELLPKVVLAGRLAPFDRALDEERPVAYRCDLPIPGLEHKAITRLLLPLSDDDGRITIVLSMVVFRLAPIGFEGPTADPAQSPHVFAADSSELDTAGRPAQAAA